MNWYLKQNNNAASMFQKNTQKEFQEPKLSLHPQKKTQSLKNKDLPVERLLKVLKKWPADEQKKSF